MDVLAWLLAVLCHRPLVPAPQPEQPDERTLYWRDPPSDQALVNMHGGRNDGVRLFARVGPWEYEPARLIDIYRSFLSDALFRVRFNHGAPSAVLQHDLWVSRLDVIRRNYFSKPFDTLCEADMIATANWLNEDGCVLALAFDPLPDFASTSSGGDVIVAVSEITGTLPDQSTLLHECAHHVQMMLRTKYMTYSNSWDYGFYRTPELASMIVENCARISQGWTEEDVAAFDTALPAMSVEPFFAANNRFPETRRPAMPASLAYQYFVKYGPKFTGDMTEDLAELRAWVPRLERLGCIDFRFYDWNAGDDCLLFARYEELTGVMDPLASTCQTWLAANGQPSLYCMFIHGDIPELPETVPMTREAALAAPGWDSGTPGSQAAALAFVARCNP